MKLVSVIFLFLLSQTACSQIELSTGYAVNRNLADGAPIHIAYDFCIKDRLYTKSQIGYKYLYHFNDFVGATMRTYVWEFHQTLSYEVIKKEKYTFKPNIGLNYRFYKWSAQMKEPLNTLPIRAWTIGTRESNFVIVSRDGEDYKEYTPNNIGFTIQLQNQFKLSAKIWLHITPFIEPDYDRSQNTGGCYIGVIVRPKCVMTP